MAERRQKTMIMKLNWFSPLPPARTEIAYHTMRVLASLREHAQVTLWTDQAEWDSSINEFTEVRRYRLSQMPWAELNRADMSIYQIGNNPLFHGSIWQVSMRHPGLVVLHDLRLQHFFAHLYLNEWRDPDAYLAQMEFYYGEAGRRDAHRLCRTKGRNIDEMAERYPLELLALENALGVLVHTEEAERHLKGMNRWPVAYAPLPFAAMMDAPRDGLHASRATSGPPYRLIVFGYISNNRRLDSLLRAIADFSERERFQLDVYGQLMDEKHVRRQLSLLGLKEVVTLHGFVPEAELESALRSAHLAINLRFPTMGEASASQLRIWSHALPSLVTAVGWYATLPANAVAFVRPEHEIEDIQAHLRAFLSDPARFARMGLSGRRLLEEQHAPEAYARTILSLAERAKAYRLHATSYKLAERAIAEVSAWTGNTTTPAALAVIARKKALIYGKTRDGENLHWLRDSKLFKRAKGSAALQRLRTLIH